MRFKTDENLGAWLADILREAGHDALTARQQGLAGAPDRDVIAACTSEARCLVTMDAEFGNPLLFNPRDYAGIVLIRVPSPVRSAALRAAARTLVGALGLQDVSAGESLAGRLWIVQPSRLRQYQDPSDPEC